MRLHRSIGGKRRIAGFVGTLAVCALGLLTARPAHADTVSWANWSNSYTAGNTTGAASASIASTPVTISYTGEVESVVANYPSWAPASSYVGGTVGNAPPQSGGIVQLFGGSYGTGTDTITFSRPVTDPVMAIWSLGQNGDTAEFDFTSNEPFTIQAGGPSNEYGGGTITQIGNNVYGAEGNGTIQFDGTYSSISWTTPVFENWYGFTAGIEGVADSVPLPTPLWSGITLIGLVAAYRAYNKFRAVA
jgi:hypothetical protein